MQFINYFFASIISFFGVLIGIILIKIAPEEQKPLEKYFILTRKILLLLIFIFIIFYYYSNAFHLLALIGYFIFLLFIEYKTDDLLKKTIISYAVLGILFFLSSENANLFAIESGLILFYGVAAASLIYSKRRKNAYKIFFYNIVFIIIANLLYFT